jgi:Starch binding domain
MCLPRPLEPQKRRASFTLPRVNWSGIVTAIVSKTAGAAVGVVAAPGGPVAVAAAGAATEQAAKALTDAILQQFRAAQQEQTEQLLSANDQVHGRLIGLQASLDTLLNAPTRTALEYIDEATRHPQDRVADLNLARQRLFDALGTTSEPVQRAFVAEQMAVVCGLLDRPSDVAFWLARAYSSILEAAETTRMPIEAAYKEASRKARNITRTRWAADETRFALYDAGSGHCTLVPVDAIGDSLRTLSTLTQRMLFLHGRALAAGALDLAVPANFVWPMGSGDRWRIDTGPDSPYLWVIAPRAVEGYAPDIDGWPCARLSFSLDVPLPTLDDGATFRVVGDCVELGAWNPAHGLLLHETLKRRFYFTTVGLSGTVFITQQSVSPVEYKFVRLAVDGTSMWEDGENRRWDPAPQGDPDAGITHEAKSKFALAEWPPP